MFVNPAPIAMGISLTSGSETPANHNAYQGGMSAWCGNCHGEYHSSGTGFQHPSDRTIGDMVNQYDRYNGSADPRGGNAATAYLPEVPFEDPGNTISGTAGPTSRSRISCITCHRAHGTSAPHAGRWDFNVAYLGQDGVQSGSWPIPNPFNNSNQKQLCAKCHDKAEAHGVGQGCLSCHRAWRSNAARMLIPAR